MNKKIILITCLICLIFLSISTASASENLTKTDLTSDDAESCNVESAIEDYSLNIQANVVEDSNDSSVDVLELDNGNAVANDSDCETTVSVYSEDKLGLDNSSCINSRSVDDTPVIKATNNKIVKKRPYLTPFKWVATTKSFTVLKVRILDKNGNLVKEGNVRFGINGKFYKVKVIKGIATKKIILTRKGAYTYSAYFTSKNYKNAVKHSKAYVKPAKNEYIFRFGKYSAKLNYQQYLSLLKAKNNNFDNYISVKVSNTYPKPVYSSITVTKKKWIYKEVLHYKSVSTYDWSSTNYYDYSLDKYYDAGWHYWGYRSVDANQGHVHAVYAKLKKLVTYTETNWYISGYDNCPVYMYIETISHDSLVKKGDYLRVWADTGIDRGEEVGVKKIDLCTYNP